MTELKLLALDLDDLGIVSAHLQDAVFKVDDIRWSPADKIFSLAANRFVWEEAVRKRKGFERRRAALRVAGLLRVPGPGFESPEIYSVVKIIGYAYAGSGGAAAGAQQQH